MSCVGMGKTTLANEICVKWAKDGFLSKEFDLVLLIPLRLAQGRSVEEVVVRHVGRKEAYEQIKNSGGEKCLIIFEGLDEIAMDRQTSDDFLVRLIKECTLLEKATLLITSRPHACTDVKAGRTFEIVGFGNHEIKKFVEKSFTDSQNITKVLQQLEKYPHIRSLCYIPMNLVMIIRIFHLKKELPSTVTELYHLFIATILQRENRGKKPIICSFKDVSDSRVEKLHILLQHIPEGAMITLFALSKLAYCGFFDWCSVRNNYWWEKDPKIIFTKEDLIQCGIEVTADWDGYGLLKVERIDVVPGDMITYNFAHLTIQEFLCAIYISTLSDQEQQQLLTNHFNDYPNVFIFLCGLTRLGSPATSQFVYKMLEVYGYAATTAVKCAYESQLTETTHSAAAPIELHLNEHLQAHDCLCVSYVLSCYPVKKLVGSLIGDTAAEMLTKHYPKKNKSGCGLQELFLHDSNLTVTGIGYVMEIVAKS